MPPDRGEGLGGGTVQLDIPDGTPSPQASVPGTAITDELQAAELQAGNPGLCNCSAISCLDECLEFDCNYYIDAQPQQGDDVCGTEGTTSNFVKAARDLFSCLGPISTTTTTTTVTTIATSATTTRATTATTTTVTTATTTTTAVTTSSSVECPTDCTASGAACCSGECLVRDYGTLSEVARCRERCSPWSDSSATCEPLSSAMAEPCAAYAPGCAVAFTSPVQAYSGALGLTTTVEVTAPVSAAGAVNTTIEVVIKNDLTGQRVAEGFQPLLEPAVGAQFVVPVTVLNEQAFVRGDRLKYFVKLDGLGIRTEPVTMLVDSVTTTRAPARPHTTPVVPLLADFARVEIEYSVTDVGAALYLSDAVETVAFNYCCQDLLNTLYRFDDAAAADACDFSRAVRLVGASVGTGFRVELLAAELPVGQPVYIGGAYAEDSATFCTTLRGGMTLTRFAA